MLSHTKRKRCELAPCCAPLHRFPPMPIVFRGQMSCCQLCRFCSEWIGFHWSCDSLCRPKKSCDLAPCWARFRRIPSTPIDSTAKISYSLISQFWVDRFNFANLAYCHIGDSLSKNGFGVTNTSNSAARDFLNSKKVWINNLSDKTCCVPCIGVTMHGTQHGWKFVAGAPRPVNPKAHPPHTGNNRDNRGENECLLFSLELEIKNSFKRT